MDEGRIRKIIHIDMDAFYASVEQRDDPTLKGKPVAVGYPARRCVVAAASYEARGFGVRSAMPSTVAIRKCAELVFVPPRFDVYREVSKQVEAIFKDYTRRNARSQRAPAGDSDFYFVSAEDPETAVQRILELVKTRIPKRFGLNPIRDIQVLCPMNRAASARVRSTSSCRRR